MTAPRTLPVGLKPYRVSSAFGIVRTINGKKTPPHNGTDWATPVGVKLEACVAGKVSAVGGSLTHIWGYFVHVKCECPEGHEEEFHILRDKPTFKVGDRIALGQTIGFTGSSGALNGARYAPHHHHSLKRGGWYYDPMTIGWPSLAADSSESFDNLEDFLSELTPDEQREVLRRLRNLDSQTTGADGQNPSIASRIINTESLVTEAASRIDNLNKQVTGADGFTDSVAARVIDLQGRAGGVDIDALAAAIVKRLPSGSLTAAQVADELAQRLVK